MSVPSVRWKFNEKKLYGVYRSPALTLWLKETLARILPKDGLTCHWFHPPNDGGAQHVMGKERTENRFSVGQCI